MRFGDPTDDGQAEPEAAILAVARLSGAVEAFEDPGRIGGLASLQPLSALRYRRSEMSTAQRARLNEIVSVDPDLMHGTPCFRGTRVPVRLLLDDLKSGFTIDEFLAGCPTVSRGFVEGYLELAQDLVTECVAS